MGSEVDFLPVGKGGRSGDAIALRFGNLFGSRREQFVMVIDGGTLESGQALVDHILHYYGTDVVDLVLSTHPDGDHASGLEVVLEKLRVGKLWMHRPWLHSRYIHNLFKDGRLTHDGLSKKMQKALEDAWDLEKIAKRKGIPIVEPFSDGDANQEFAFLKVLGPSTAYYQSLLPQFREMPDLTHAAGSWLSRGMVALAEAATDVIAKVAEGLNVETLVDPEEDATSAENNSSAIVHVEWDGHRMFFTGDAGVPALERAADFAEFHDIDLQTVNLTQVTHHGSKRNVGPTILNRILGPKLPVLAPSKVAFVSASEGGTPKHPAKKVTNAYQRRGRKVIATQGVAIWHSVNAPERGNYGPAAPVPFYREVDE